MSAAASTRATTRWTVRIIPLVLIGCVGFATYVEVARVCVDYWLHERHDDGLTLAFLILYFILLLLMALAYIRTIYAIMTDPGLVPLGPLATERKNAPKKRDWRQAHDIEAQEYDAGRHPDPNPDSPGLEQFYTKDVFVCESDGRPRWCSECCNWKPDRSHHSSEINRCVRKMDHFCPWVGGMVSETSFKFFVQFTFYTVAYCALVLGSSAYTLSQQITIGLHVDGMVIANIVLAAFFGLFTFLMTATSLRFVLVNLTNIDVIRAKHRVYQLAVRVPRGTEATANYSIINYPLSQQLPRRQMNGHAAGGQSSPRDDLASRTFAIVRTEPGENPWDLGTARNWTSVMGTNVLDWFLPFRQSPCIIVEGGESFYPMGRVVSDVRARYGLDGLSREKHGTEMREVRNGRQT